jgi:hypothetical protein
MIHQQADVNNEEVNLHIIGNGPGGDDAIVNAGPGVETGDEVCI